MSKLFVRERQVIINFFEVEADDFNDAIEKIKNEHDDATYITEETCETSYRLVTEKEIKEYV